MDELANNLRVLELVLDDGVSLGDVVKDLSTSEYDRLLREGFNFSALKRKRIARMASLDSTDLQQWQGKETGALIDAIYGKLKDIKVKFPHTANSSKYRWNVRAQNIRKRIWLLARHLSA